MRTNYRKTSAAEYDFIKTNFDTMSNKELAEELGIKTAQVRNIYRQLNLRRSEGNGRFEKGNISHNKGVKMSTETYKKASKTFFKKGNTPHNHKPVGSERVTKDGYIEIKTKEPNVWNLKQRVVWEEHNPKHPLLKEEIISFKDGDPLNIEIYNLVKKDRITNMLENSKHNYTKEIIPSKVLVCKIKKHIKNK